MQSLRERFTRRILVQYGAKSIATCKKNPYIINQKIIVKSFLDRF